MIEEVRKALETADELNRLASEYERMDKALNTIKNGEIMVQEGNISYKVSELFVDQSGIRDLMISQIGKHIDEVVTSINKTMGAKEERKKTKEERKKTKEERKETKEERKETPTKPVKAEPVGLDLDEVKRIYIDEGMPMNDTAKYFHVQATTMQKFLRDNGLLKPKGRPKKEVQLDEESVKKLYIDKDMNLKDAADMLGVSKSKLWSYCNEHGIVKPRYRS